MRALRFLSLFPIRSIFKEEYYGNLVSNVIQCVARKLKGFPNFGLFLKECDNYL